MWEYVCLCWGSNSRPPDQEPDAYTTELSSALTYFIRDTDVRFLS